MRNNTGPRVKRSFLERQMNREVLYCVGFLVLMCATAALGTGIWDAGLLPPHRDWQNTSYLPCVAGGWTGDRVPGGGPAHAGRRGRGRAGTRRMTRPRPSTASSASGAHGTVAPAPAARLSLVHPPRPPRWLITEPPPTRSFFIILQAMVPISLYITIEIVKLGQVFFIQEDQDLYHAESNVKSARDGGMAAGRRGVGVRRLTPAQRGP